MPGLEMIPEGFHIGQRIAEVIEDRGMTKAGLGRKINSSRQNINTLLKRSSVDVYTLFRICIALKHNFFDELARMVAAGSSAELTNQPSNIAVMFSFAEPGNLIEEIQTLQRLYPNSPRKPGKLSFQQVLVSLPGGKSTVDEQPEKQ